MKKKAILGALGILVIFVFLQAQYHFLFKTNRYWDNNGVFSTDGRIQTVGESNTVRYAYTNSLYTDIKADEYGELYIGKVLDTGENESALNFEISYESADELRQGAIYFYGQRPEGSECTSWGGSPDMAMKMHLRNYSASGLAALSQRVAEFICSNRGTLQDIWAVYASAESRSGTSSNGIYAGQFNYDQSGNVNTEHAGIWVHDNSQSDVGTNYGVKLWTANYNQTREYAFWIGSQNGSWVNGVSFNDAITYVFDFENTDGTNGAGYNAGFTGPAGYAVPDGYITVDIGGNIQYIYTWTTKPT
jgi:hypothetical protein